MTTIIPAHENVDIDTSENYVTLSQATDGITESVRFHKRYIDDVIRALDEAKGPNHRERIEAIMSECNSRAIPTTEKRA